MAVIISIYGIEVGVRKKFGPRFNKEVTFLSIVSPVGLIQLVSLSTFVIPNYLRVFLLFTFQLLKFFLQMTFTVLVFIIF